MDKEAEPNPAGSSTRDAPATDTTLSVVLPCYRAASLLETQLPLLKRHLAGLSITHEVLVCDDGSADGGATQRVAEQHGCTYVAHPTNRGKGAAVRTGMLAARGRYRCFMDADIPFELDAIDASLRILREGRADVVLGDRTLVGSSYYRTIPPARRFASVVFAHIVRRVSSGETADTQCGFKAFTAQAAVDIFSRARIDRFAADVEWLLIAHRLDHRVERIPVRLRNEGASTVHIVSDSLSMLRDLLRIKRYDRLGYYSPARPAPAPARDDAPSHHP